MRIVKCEYSTEIQLDGLEGFKRGWLMETDRWPLMWLSMGVTLGYSASEQIRMRNGVNANPSIYSFGMEFVDFVDASVFAEKGWSVRAEGIAPQLDGSIKTDFVNPTECEAGAGAYRWYRTLQHGPEWNRFRDMIAELKEDLHSSQELYKFLVSPARYYEEAQGNWLCKERGLKAQIKEFETRRLHSAQKSLSFGGEELK